MTPQARHFVKDLTAEQLAALPPWQGDPARVYQGVAEVLLENFPAMKAAGGAGADMNAQILVGQLGGALVPTDEERLRSGPPSFARQQAMQAGGDSADQP